MTRDPICGMNIDESAAAGRSEYQGRTYFFCSSACKTKFDQNPQQYAGRSSAEPGRGEVRK